MARGPCRGYPPSCVLWHTKESMMASDLASPTAFSDAPKPVLRRAIAASAVGNMAEWYDYGVYAYVSVEIGRHFFPGDHQTLLTVMVFAVSFVLRPLGGIIWGVIGDRRGRRFLAHHNHLAHFCGHVLYGPDSHPGVHWTDGTRPADRVTRRSGIVDRRRIRRRCNVHGRVRALCTTRVLRQLPGSGNGLRFHSRRVGRRRN
jgi:hypothetical protein